MKNKTIANWLIVSLSLAGLNGVMSMGEWAYTISGIGFLVFGIMAIVRLYKLENK